MRVAMCGASLCVSQSLSARLLAHAPSPDHGKRRPRYYIVLCLAGGFDPVRTTDPRRRGDAHANVDIPYAPSDIVRSGGVELGPDFGPMAAWLDDLAIVNGVRISTANHPSGIQSHMRMKDGASERSPSLLEILGSTRAPSQPLSSVAFGTFFGSQQYTPRYFGVPNGFLGGSGQHIFDRADGMEPDEAKLLARVLHDNARKVRRQGDDNSADSIDQAAGFFERVAESTKFQPSDWLGDHAIPESSYHMEPYLQRALWVLENDLTGAVYIQLGGGQAWDTHFDNSRRQATISAAFMRAFDRFMQELKRRKGVGGRSLFDDSVIVASSEIGRHPGTNDALGKDHFPQIPMFFGGRWFHAHGRQSATYGATGPDMAGVPVSLSSGRPQRGGHLLRVDDVGTTLLTIAGLNPELYGYQGRFLEFLART